MKAVSIIFPHQLFKDIHWLAPGRKVYLVEEHLFFKQYCFHKQKLAFHRATMKFYEEYLVRQACMVHYLESADSLSDIRTLLPYLKKEGVEELYVIDPVDNWLGKRLQVFHQAFIWHKHECPGFINTTHTLQTYFGSGLAAYHQTDFYKQQRLTWNLLVPEGRPAGGRWSFDAENRKRYPSGKIPPAFRLVEASAYFEEAKDYVSRQFPDNYGSVGKNPIYPVTFRQCDDWLDDFLTNRFAGFGAYQDSIVKEEHFLHHSILSPLLNSGLVTPKELVEKILFFADREKIPLNSVEGFLRQIIGWREFVRGVYITDGTRQRRSNFWQHQHRLPACFYNGSTGIAPIDSSIRKLLKTGYLHHIERLMLLANFMNLCLLHPDAVYEWFMEMFVDAYDWVMVPNVYGMGLFADGGLMSTKPYVSGSNYVLKMSNYKPGGWSKIWDGLFWHFVTNHQAFFANHPRLSLLLASWQKMEPEKKRQQIQLAKAYLKQLHQPAESR